jgi:cyclopropane-fatty-acyl-phospholipid synthase
MLGPVPTERCFGRLWRASRESCRKSENVRMCRTGWVELQQGRSASYSTMLVMNRMFAPLRFIFDRLIQAGDLTVVDHAGAAYRFGDGSGLPLTVRFTTAAAERAVAYDPQLFLPEAYMNGSFIVEDGRRIYDFLEMALSGSAQLPLPVWVKSFDVLRFLTRRIAQYNPVGRAKRNVAHHYDIDGSIYDLFLDRDKQYSCAYFEPGHDDLEEAQLAKKRHVAAKLALKPGHKVLDIGSGWGGLGLYLASAANVDVTGVTLSQEQIKIANIRAKDQRLDQSVRFRLQDYRRVPGPFDRIVSVGMFEHVGINHYGTFFRKIRELLTVDGVAVVHSIGRADEPAATNPFIRKYIFPGGYVPALSEVMPAIERSGLYINDVEILRLHYAETLRHWRSRFLARWREAEALKGEEFCRMWEFYLAGSECAFRFQNMMVFQLQLTRRVGTLPQTRDYMVEEERRMKSRDAGAFAPRLAGE